MRTGPIWATVLIAAHAWAATEPLRETTFEGFYTGEIIPTPHWYKKVRGEVPLARRGAATSDACVLVGAEAPPPVRLGAEELRARVARLLGPKAPALAIVDSPRAAKGFGAAIALGPTAGQATAMPAPGGPAREQAYYIRAEGSPVYCWGESPVGTYFGVQTLMQLIYERDGAAYLQRAQVTDWPMFALRSFKTGGQDGDLLREMGRWCGHYKYNCYNVCYTTLGTDQWKSPPPEYRTLLADLCAFRVPRGLDVMPFVNPYYLWKEHIVISDDPQLDALADTCALAMAHGARKVMLCLDDFASEHIPYVIRSEADRARFKTLGEANAHLITELHRRLKARYPDCELFVVPPYYWLPAGSYKEQGEADLRVIGQSIPKDVHLVWTGPGVRSATMRREDLDAYTALIGRRPFLWDNTLYMHHNPPSYLFDPFVTKYPDRFWELNDTGVHYNAGGGEVYKVGLMTTADYLWNPEAYDPQASLRRALDQATGDPRATDACLALRDAYYRIYDGYKPLLDSLVKLKTTGDIPYRPFDAQDLDRIESDLRALTAAHDRVKATCRNARLVAELGEFAGQFGRQAELITWFRAHLPPETSLTDIAVNGGAEDVDAQGRPVGWGLYGGAGPATIGSSEEAPAEGKRCATLEATQWYNLGGRDWLNVALMQGDSNGFTGPNAYPAQPLTKYRVRFRIRGDVGQVSFSVVGWSDDRGTAEHRESLFCSLSDLPVTPEWRQYEGSFTTTLNTKRFALKFGIVGYRDEGAKLGRICVDDVHLLCVPAPKP